MREITKVEYESNAIDLINTLNALPIETIKSLNLYQNINDQVAKTTHFTEGKGKSAHIHTQIFQELFMESLIKYANPKVLSYALNDWIEKYPLKMENVTLFLNRLFETEDMEKIDIGLEYIKEFKNKHNQDFISHICNKLEREGHAFGLQTYLYSHKSDLNVKNFQPVWDKYVKFNLETLNFSKIIALSGIFSIMLNQDQKNISQFILEDLQQRNMQIPESFAYLAFNQNELDLFKNIVDIHSKTIKSQPKKNNNKNISWEDESFNQYTRYRWYNENNESLDNVYSHFIKIYLDNDDVKPAKIEMIKYLEAKSIVKMNEHNVVELLATKIILAHKQKDLSQVAKDVESAFKYMKKNNNMKSYFELFKSCVSSEYEFLLLTPLLSNENYVQTFKEQLSELAKVKIVEYLKENGNIDKAAKETIFSLVPLFDNKEEIFSEIKKTPLREKLYFELEVKTEELKKGKKIKL